MSDRIDIDIDIDIDSSAVARAEHAASVLREHAAETERTGAVARPSLQAATVAGAFRLGTPQRFGGMGATLSTICAVLQILGAGCASTGWSVATSLESQLFFTPFMTEEQLAALYQTPDLHLSGSGAAIGQAVIRGERIVLNGSWAYATGVLDASWVMVTAVVRASSAADCVGIVLIPRALVTVEETWHVAGLQGTGSHTVVAHELDLSLSSYVPFPVTDDGHPDFGSRPEASVVVPLLLVSPLVGAAREALRLATARVQRKRLPSRPTPIGDSPGHRLELLDASAQIALAQTAVASVAAQVDARAITSAAEAARAAFDLAEAARRIRAGLEHIMNLGGSSAFAADDPLQRIWRDVNMGTRHAALDHGTAEAAYAAVLRG